MLATDPVTAHMRADPVTLPHDATLTDAWTLMLNGGFHHVPVVDTAGGRRRLVGLLSSRDLAARLLSLPREILDTGVVLNDDAVAVLMTRDLVTVGPQATIRDAAQALATGAFHALPVVDDRGEFLGLLTSTDLVRGWLTEG